MRRPKFSWPQALKIGAMFGEAGKGIEFAWHFGGYAVSLVGSGSVFLFLEKYSLHAALFGGATTIGAIIKATQMFTAIRYRGRTDNVVEARRAQLDASNEFDQALRRYRSAPTPSLLADLVEKHWALWKAICDTAVAIFNADKPSFAPFSANIKSVMLDDPEKTDVRIPCFGMVVSSDDSDSDRAKFNATIKGEHIPISECYWYDQMFDPRYANDHYSHPNRKTLHARLKEEKFEFKERAMPDFFQSWLAAPI
jgi:hypothetical protein